MTKWREEGIECYFLSETAIDHIPLFHLYKWQVEDHFYTTNKQEMQKAAPKEMPE